MYEDFLENWCKHWNMSREDALKLAIVKEFMAEKERLDNDVSELRRETTSERH